MPGTWARSQREVSMPDADSRAPSSVPANSSSVTFHPDSSGTVPSAATFSAGAGRAPLVHSVQPVAFGRLPGAVPYTWRPLRPSGLSLDSPVPTIRIQRAVTGSSRVISTVPPLSVEPSYTFCQALPSREASMRKCVA